MAKGEIDRDWHIRSGHLCFVCARGMKGENPICEAFPKGIPEEILSGGFDHRKPFKGDNGICFKPMGDETDRLIKIHDFYGEPHSRDERMRFLRKYDPEFRQRLQVRAQLRSMIRGNDSPKARKLVGCSRRFLMKHLESQFKPCMDWECYGSDWHVDHIVPLSRFQLTDPKQRRKACHWSNLRPMWAEDNERKGDN